MAQRGSLIYFSDNAGFATAKCLHVYYQRKGVARLGSLLLVVVRHRLLLQKIEKKKIYHALLVAQRRVSYRKQGGYYFRFDRAKALTVVREQLSLNGHAFTDALPLELMNSLFIDNSLFRYVI
jgi:ribosomal protein L14